MVNANATDTQTIFMTTGMDHRFVQHQETSGTGRSEAG